MRSGRRPRPARARGRTPTADRWCASPPRGTTSSSPGTAHQLIERERGADPAPDLGDDLGHDRVDHRPPGGRHLQVANAPRALGPLDQRHLRLGGQAQQHSSAGIQRRTLLHDPLAQRIPGSRQGERRVRVQALERAGAGWCRRCPAAASRRRRPSPPPAVAAAAGRPHPPATSRGARHRPPPVARTGRPLHRPRQRPPARPRMRAGEVVGRRKRLAAGQIRRLLDHRRAAERAPHRHRLQTHAEGGRAACVTISRVVDSRRVDDG